MRHWEGELKARHDKRYIYLHLRVYDIAGREKINDQICNDRVSILQKN